ncbi:hypothetical protein [Clostridium saccharoperbutylacetonicum]|uniref:hypothetical protein n=1 Tax=Clostridium saccharoperbutylacetonicum TaxID=36745 RepID=UPI00098394B8|nr:hypothetical protein [Clostridium saccharoperbutylacetonicum]AQR95590.1 hypothetical protein CLSAP_29060 [Clostridium saccharoperbutylacetonicum]NSB31451.1 hypothetical protein [Clostridium saccharoperbutylacetonicum]
MKDFFSDCIWTDLTDFNCRVNEFIAEIKATIPNAACFALSDKLLTYYTKTLQTYNSENIVLDKDRNIYLAIRAKTDSSNDNIQANIKINVEEECIEFTVNLLFFFFKDNTNFATVDVQFLLKSKPNMNIDYIEFQTFEIRVLTYQTNQSIKVIDQNILNQEYGDINQFVIYVNNLLDEFADINNFDSQVKGILPALINIIELPSDWRYFEGIILESPNFYYRHVRLMGEDSGCLYITFSVRSLNRPYPCVCDNLNDSNNMDVSSVPINSKRWIVMGISEGAMFEIFKPIVDNKLNIYHSDSSGNGEIRAELSYWISGYLNNLRLLKNGIHCEVDNLNSGGYVAAAIRVLKRDIWKKKVGIELKLNDVQVDFIDFKFGSTPYEEGNRFKIIVQPKVAIGDINVELQPDISELEWVSELIMNGNKALIEKKAEESLKFSPFNKPNERYPTGIMITEYSAVDFFENSSLVLIMQQKWID